MEEKFDIKKSFRDYQDKFLTEGKLESYLKLIFPNEIFIHNKTFPGYRFRPDFRCDNLKLVVEFDGDRHYTQAKVILNDQYKDYVLKEHGYKIVRIPNFVQLSTEVIKFLFGVDYEFEQIFPHGFISKEVTLPADFCCLGIKKFNNDLDKFEFCKQDIIDSLINKVEDKGTIYHVVPLELKQLADKDSLYYRCVKENIKVNAIRNTIAFRALSEFEINKEEGLLGLDIFEDNLSRIRYFGFVNISDNLVFLNYLEDNLSKEELEDYLEEAKDLSKEGKSEESFAI